MTGPNTSAAVKQQRRPRADLELGPRGFARALDYFPTPPWATRALCEFLDQQGERLPLLSCWEPACGEGHMARALAESFARVTATDVHRYGDHHAICDFLVTGRSWPQVDWIVTNPPFAMAERFIDVALDKAVRGVAMFVRSAFTESEGRAALFADCPPAFVLQFTQRVVLLEQRLIRANAPDPFNPNHQANGLGRGASSATSYCWLIWQRDGRGGWKSDTRHRWIGKVRDRLDRVDDYPTYPQHQHPLAPAQAGEGALL